MATRLVLRAATTSDLPTPIRLAPLVALVAPPVALVVPTPLALLAVTTSARPVVTLDRPTPTPMDLVVSRVVSILMALPKTPIRTAPLVASVVTTPLAPLAVTTSARPVVTTPTALLLAAITLDHPTPTPMDLVASRVVAILMALRTVMNLQPVVAMTPTKVVLSLAGIPTAHQAVVVTPMAPRARATTDRPTTTRTAPPAVAAIAPWVKSWRRLAVFLAAASSRSVAKKSARQREGPTITTSSGRGRSSLIHLTC